MFFKCPLVICAQKPPSCCLWLTLLEGGGICCHGRRKKSKKKAKNKSWHLADRTSFAPNSSAPERDEWLEAISRSIEEYAKKRITFCPSRSKGKSGGIWGQINEGRLIYPVGRGGQHINLAFTLYDMKSCYRILRKSMVLPDFSFSMLSPPLRVAQSCKRYMLIFSNTTQRTPELAWLL